MILCETDAQVDATLASAFTRAFVLNLTPTGAHWANWGSKHPLGDDWALSVTHRSTSFTRDEMRDICRADHRRRHPAHVLHRHARGRRRALREVVPRRGDPAGSRPDDRRQLHDDPVPETRELADDGLPRWHHLYVRYSEELNRQLAAA